MFVAGFRSDWNREPHQRELKSASIEFLDDREVEDQPRSTDLRAQAITTGGSFITARFDSSSTEGFADKWPHSAFGLRCGPWEPFNHVDCA